MSKPQDGFVSRYLNRPISRGVSRILLKFPIHPNAWTISIFALPLIACFFLIRGDYGGVVTGAAIFQLYSVLDGCDGEIARAKGLESKFGERLDHVCDFLASLLFVIALGFGLYRPIEGIACAALIAGNEFLLNMGQSRADAVEPKSGDLFYPRHREMIDQSGLGNFEGVIWWIAQFTKRDVVTLFFLLLAIVNLAPWILHLWTAFAAASLVFSGIALAKSRR
jgi:CDP-L-myo-inositol myo-inositolphosphotransferase